MSVSSTAAIAAAKAESAKPSHDYAGLCLKFVRTTLGIPAKYASAIKAWNGAQHKHHDDDPPAGASVFWQVGRFGHIALSAGGGKVWSTDIHRRGKVDLVPIAEIHQRWGATYLGWTEDLNGEAVKLVAPKAVAELDPRVRPGAHHPQVKLLQRALIDAGFGPIHGSVSDFYGPETQYAVIRFHQTHPGFALPIQRDPAIGPRGFSWLQAHIKEGK